MNTNRLYTPLLALGLAAGLLVACGGGGGGSANQPPVATIASPAQGATFQAGDAIAFSGSASDAEDGAIPASGLTWWAELHHDTHTHPFHPETAGGSGSVDIPVRGETSDNIFYRFHLRATDSRGLSSEATRDLLPRKAQVTLATQPTGLALTLDGQPVNGPMVFTGVVGIERDLGAADQNFNGRRYRFDSWSDSQAATHTISTPASATTYTASFTDLGPIANQAPSVALSAPAAAVAGTATTLSATASDSDGSIAKVEFFDDGTLIGTDTTSPYTVSWTPASAGTHTLTARATDDGGLATTSIGAAVSVSPASGADTQAPTAALTAPADLATGLTGTLTLSATASDNVGVAGVEFQLDGVIVGSEDTSAPYSVTVNSGSYAAGQHVVRARARDAAGNLSAWSSATVKFGGSAGAAAGFTKNESWVTGMGSSVAFAQAPDGRIFVCEQGGKLRVVKNGVLQPAAFHTFTVDSNGERGLLGVAFDPAFASNGFVYVYYTATTPATHNRISRLVANGDVSTGAETVLVDLPNLSSATNHNGGALHFGIDGKLYVGVGDNANSAKSQDLNEVFGKVLRFNADGSIPSDNPFCGTAGTQKCAIWARGLRNPFTFAVQPATGRIHINDVGQNTWEEIDLGAAGANYGWPGSEGPDNITSGITAPIFTYKHSSASPAGSGPGGFFVGFAIAGGAFYPTSGGNFPASYRGNYFFADYVSQWVGLLDLANGNAAYAFANLGGPPVDLLVGQDGALYVLTTNGSITRISTP